MLSIHDVWTALGEQAPPEGLPNQTLAAVVIDSREATPGSCFVALRGEKQDGHDFVADAFQRGAVLAIVQRDPEVGSPVLNPRSAGPVGQIGLPFCLWVSDCLIALQRMAAAWRARFSPRVIGITGSVGKTSTKELVYSVLRQRYKTLRSEGNLNNEIGLPLTLLRLTGEHRAVVLEMGMYALGEIATLAAIAQPQVGIVTNVGPSHLERLGTLENIAAAKAELVEALPADGVAILNADDPFVRDMAKKTRAQVFTYGLEPGSDLWASDIESRGLEGIRFYFHHGSQALQVKVPLLGRHSVHTALRAAATGLVEGLSWEEIVAGLQNVGAQLRLIAVPGIHGTTLLDDTYNASPASSIAALNLLADLEGRRIAVLGDMLELGKYEREGHQLVGLRAADVVHKLVAVGPRARWLAEAAVAGGMKKEDVFVAENNDMALRYLSEIVSPGDIILVKGSRAQGMEAIVAAFSRRTAE
jgi:UDP-N-acetylmuramoyl-tripeptide--D-alanyl-D-alanine ligase